MCCQQVWTAWWCQRALVSISSIQVPSAAALHPRSKGFSFFHILKGFNWTFSSCWGFDSTVSLLSFKKKEKAIKPLTACPRLHLLNKTAFLLAITFPVEAWITEPLDAILFFRIKILRVHFDLGWYLNFTLLKERINFFYILFSCPLASLHLNN